MSYLWRFIYIRVPMNIEGSYFSWNTSSCHGTSRRMEIQYPLRGPKPRDIRSKKVRWVPTVAEQSQIYIKRPRVSGVLLTIIPSHDCRAGWSMKPQTKAGTRLSGASVLRARLSKLIVQVLIQAFYLYTSRILARQLVRRIAAVFFRRPPCWIFIRRSIFAQFYLYDELYITIIIFAQRTELHSYCNNAFVKLFVCSLIRH